MVCLYRRVGQLLICKDAYGFKLRVGTIVLTFSGPAAKLISILALGRLALDGFNVSDVRLANLLLLFKGLEMEGSMIKTLLEVLLALAKPFTHQLLPVHLSPGEVHGEPGAKNRDHTARPLGQHCEHLLAKLSIHNFNVSQAKLVKFSGVQLEIGFLSLRHSFNFLCFLFKDLQGPLKANHLEVHAIHIVLNAEEAVLILILGLELEAFRALGKAREVLIEHILIECGILLIGSSSEAEGSREVLRHLKVRVGYLGEIVSLELRQGLA